MNWRNLFLVLGMFGASLSAREWRSSDGSRTLEAEFTGLKEGNLLLKTKDGKSTLFPATAFSKEDQQFAQQAQVTLEAAVIRRRHAHGGQNQPRRRRSSF
jgi:hypothetical protein